MSHVVYVISILTIAILGLCKTSLLPRQETKFEKEIRRILEIIEKA
jgi:hypothetical protein